MWEWVCWSSKHRSSASGAANLSICLPSPCVGEPTSFGGFSSLQVGLFHKEHLSSWSLTRKQCLGQERLLTRTNWLNSGGSRGPERDRHSVKATQLG